MNARTDERNNTTKLKLKLNQKHLFRSKLMMKKTKETEQNSKAKNCYVTKIPRLQNIPSKRVLFAICNSEASKISLPFYDK